MSYDPYDDDPARRDDPPEHRADVALAERDRREEQGSTAPRDVLASPVVAEHEEAA